MRYNILICIMILSGVKLMAQSRPKDSTTNIKIIQTYKPKLIEARKIETVPVIEKPMATTPSYTYTIEPKKVKTDKTVSNIPAADLFKSEEFNYPSSFVKLGYGNLKTPLAELYFNNKRDTKYSYGVQYRFLQSDSKFNNAFADFTNHNVKGYLASYSDSGEFGLEASFKQNKFNYYGYVDTNKIAEKNLGRIITNFEAKAYYTSVSYKSDKVKHRTAFNFYNYQIGNAIENDYTISSKIYGNVSDFNDLENGILSATVGFDYTTFQIQNQKVINRIFLQIDPRFDFKYDVLNVSAGLNTTIFFAGNDTARPFVNPFIKVTYPLIEDVATIYGGIDGRYRKQSLKSIIQTNQFTSNYNLTNNYENIKLFAGITAKVGSSADAVFEINYTDITNMPLYISTKDSFNSFAIITDQANVLKFTAAFNYSFSEVARIGFTGNFYNYEFKTQPQPWQLPNIEGKVNMKFNIKNKIYPHFDIMAMSLQKQRTGLNEVTYTTNTMKAFYDISAGIDFRFRPKLSLFVQANNVMASRYQRWYNYPTYGFNLIGGLTAIF